MVAVEKTGYAVSDASRAIHSMLLMAWSEGVGSNWVGFGGLEKINALLEIPAGLDALAILPFGYPADRIGRGRKDRQASAVPSPTASATASPSNSHTFSPGGGSRNDPPSGEDHPPLMPATC